MKSLVALSLLVLSVATNKADDRFGIATGDPHPDPYHFGVASGWNQIAYSGAGWVRFDIPWISIEPNQGTYSLDPEKLNFLQLAHAAGLKTCIMSMRGHPAIVPRGTLIRLIQWLIPMRALT